MKNKTSGGKSEGGSISGNQVKDKEERKEMDPYIESMEKKEREYIVDGALLKCSCGTKRTRKIEVDGKMLLSEPKDVEENSRIYLEDKKETINGQAPAGVTDSLGGMRGEEERDKKREGEEEEGEEEERVNIVSFGNCILISAGEDLDKLLESQKLMDKKDKIIEAIKEGKGTCYCFMKLNKEWENLSIPESKTEEKNSLPKAGHDKVRPSSYMKFNGEEGINLSSTLFCRFRQGIIQAVESGQTEVKGRRVYIPKKVKGKKHGEKDTLYPRKKWGRPAKGDEPPQGVQKDDQGRYKVAVGPKVLDPDYPDDGKIWRDDFGEYPVLRVVLRHNETGEEKVIECVIEQIKAHSYNIYPYEDQDNKGESAFYEVENGLVQTGIRYPNAGNPSIHAENNNDSSVIEFFGQEVDFDYDKYTLEELIVLDE